MKGDLFDKPEPGFDGADKVAANAQAFRAAGYEVAAVSVPRVSGGPELNPIYLRIKNQPSVLFANVHGHRDTGTMLFGFQKSQDPDIRRDTLNLGLDMKVDDDGDIMSTDWGCSQTGVPANLQLAVLASCGILDINDYNKMYSTSNALPPYSPGLKWDKVMGGDARPHILLGYNRIINLPTDGATFGDFINRCGSAHVWSDLSAGINPAERHEQEVALN